MIRLNLNRREFCPRCKGRRKVFNPMSLLLTVALPIAFLMDAEITKKTCPVCKGEGKIDI